MDYENTLENENQRRREAGKLAIEKVRAMSLPSRLDLPEKLDGIGSKANRVFQAVKENLTNKFGAALPKIMSVALHEYWLECWRCALYMQAGIDDQSMNDNDYTQRMATAQGYADIEGWAYTLSNGFADLKPSEARIEGIKALTGYEIIDSTTALSCMALHWLHGAAVEMKKGHIELAFDLVYEAYDALSLDGGKEMWDQGWAHAIESEGEKISSKARFELARKAGRAAHVETYALKAEIKEFWKKNISPELSNDAAGAVLARQFPMNPRTLSKYVSEFKRTAG